MIYPVRPAAFLRATAFSALLLLLPLAAEQASRLGQVSDELATLQTVIAKLPAGRERRQLEQRRALLERERDILKQRQQLEEQEHALNLKRQNSPTARLQESLRTVTPNPQSLQTRLASLNEHVRAVTARQETQRAERQRLASASRAHEGASDLAALDDQMLTTAEEMEALQLEREAVVRGLDLVREAEAVSVRLHDEPAVPPLQLKIWWERRRDLEEHKRRLADADATDAAMGERHAAADDAVALAKEKLARLDEEIALLAPQTSFFRSTPGVDQLLTAARRDKEAISARLPYIEAQRAALDEARTATAALARLLHNQVDWLRERQALLTDRYLRWLTGPAATIAVLLVLFVAISRLVLPWLYKNEMLVSARRVNRYLMIAALAASLALFFFEDLRVLATTLGIVSAALVIALQDVFVSLAGWFALIASRKVHVGDRIEVDGVKGDVLEIELLRTTLLEVGGTLGFDHPTGRIVALPNSFIFRSRVYNASYGHRWIWLRTDITVTYETPVAAAAAVLRRALEEETAPEFSEARRDAAVMTDRYGRTDAEYEPKIYCAAADSGVMFSLVCLADCRQVPAMRTRLHQRILADFARDPRLHFAYPTQRAILSREIAGKAPAPTLSP
jgi:small-conductance mechanosensitive channel